MIIIDAILKTIAGTTILALGLGLGLQDGILNHIDGFFENSGYAIFGMMLVVKSHKALSEKAD